MFDLGRWGVYRVELPFRDPADFLRPMTFHRLSLALLLALSLAACDTFPIVEEAQAESAPLHLVVLHTNDVHGQAAPRSATWLDKENPPQLGGLPRLAGELHAVAEAEREAGALVLAVDGGDWYQGTPEGLVDGGKVFASLLASVDYDGMVVGNHEFDHGTKHLAELIVESGAPAILANVRVPATGKRVAWAKPYRIVKFGAGERTLTVALVGLLTPDTPTITHADARKLDFTDPGEELTRAIAELRASGDRIDLILPVTHLGVNRDRELARAHPELPLIVGGHSHTTLREGVREGTTLIVQTGCKATVLGRVDLWLDPVTFAVRRSSACLIELRADETRTDAVLAAACAELIAEGAKEMDTQVGTLAADLTRSRELVSGSAGNWITDVMRAKLGCDIGIQNRGGIRRNLDAGDLTRRELFEMLPFGNTLVAIDLTGAQLFGLAQSAVEDRKHSGIEFSGMRLVYRGEWPDGALDRVEVGGLPVDPKAMYRVATNSFLAGGGDGYLPKSALDGKKTDTGLILRDLMEEALAAGAGDHVDAGNRFDVEPAH